MSQSVIILMPNGRRESVKLTPNSLVQPLFVDLCQKHGFSASNYILKTSTGHPVDSSIPFRLTGIPNRAVLESCLLSGEKSSEVAKIVNVAVQMPSGERRVVEIEDTSPLWDILEKLFEKDPSLLDEDEMEACFSFMGHSFRGADVLLKKTLRECGIQGRALLRLSFAPRLSVDSTSAVSTEELDMASAQNSVINLNSSPKSASKCSHDTAVSSHFSEETKTTSYSQPLISSSRSSQLPEQLQPFSWIPGQEIDNSQQIQNFDLPMSSDFQTNRFANFKFPEKTKEIEENSEPESSAPEQPRVLEDRGLVVFSLKGIDNSIHESIPDDFFEITIDDVKVMQKLREKEVKQMINQPLISEETRKRKIISKYSNTATVRFVFPDRMIVQAKFLLTESSKNLYDFVDSVLKPDLNQFYSLFTTPPKSVIDRKKEQTILDIGLFPAVNIHVSFGQCTVEGFLRESVLSQEISAYEVFKSSSQEKPYSHKTESAEVVDGSENARQHAAGLNRSIDAKIRSSGASVPKDAPKWFAAGLKK